MPNPRRGNAPVARGVGEAAKLTTGTRKPKGHRPELQGLATGRNPDQRPPTWAPPAGSDAADALLRALAGWSALLGQEPVDPRGRK